MEQENSNDKNSVENLRKKLIQQEKLASIGLRTTGIMHEIKNPLNFVLNFSLISKEILAELLELSQKASIPSDKWEEISETFNVLSDSLNKIYENGKRAEKIMQTMLSQSRGDPPEKLDLINIHELIQQAFGLAYSAFCTENPQYNISVVYNFDKTIAPIPASPSSLQRVFLNIFDNAYYATKEKLRGINNTAYVPTLTVTTKNDSSHIEIVVEDNGTGIPAENIAKIFTPFFTSKPVGAGTGLGLAISRDVIIQEHHGEITVESRLNEFTKFTIRLPKEQTT